jgi:hypothetical protein
MQTKFVLVNEADNVLVCCQAAKLNELIMINGQYFKMSSSIDVGHKIANCSIRQGQKIIRYGVSIGSSITDIKTGEHVHLHNMKSDYIPSHTRHSVTGG